MPGVHSAPPRTRACLGYRINRDRSSSDQEVVERPCQLSPALSAGPTSGELPPGCSDPVRPDGEPLKTGSPCSVHAAVAPFLRSLTVSTPAAIACSPHRRRADQNAVLHRARQNR